MNRNLEIFRHVARIIRAERDNDPLGGSALNVFYSDDKFEKDVELVEEIMSEKNANGLTQDGYPVSP